MSVPHARRALMRVLLQVGTIRYVHRGQQEGTVIAQNPPAGILLTMGESVDLVVTRKATNGG